MFTLNACQDSTSVLQLQASWLLEEGSALRAARLISPPLKRGLYGGIR
jgi:hypothetical protein